MVARPLKNPKVKKALFPKKSKSTTVATKQWVRSNTGDHGVHWTTIVTQPAMGGLLGNTLGQLLIKGDGYGDRTGNKIFLKKAEVTIRLNNNNVSHALFMRIALCKLKRPTSTPQQETWEPEGNTFAPVDFLGPDSFNVIRKWNKNQFEVLYDQKFKIGINTGDHSPSNVFYKNIQVPINKSLTYNTNLSSDTQILPIYKWLYFFESVDGVGIPSTDVDRRMDFREHFIA